MQFAPSEVYQSDTPPENPVVGQLWRNTGVTPNELLAWNGKGASNARSYAVNKNAPTIRIEDLSDRRAIAVTTGAAATVRRTGKNLLTKSATITNAGVTCTVAEDGTISLTGTCSLSAGSPALIQIQMGYYLSGLHTFSAGNTVAYGADLQLRLLQSAGTAVSSPGTNFPANSIGAKNTFTLTNQFVYGYGIRVQGGVTYAATLKPQLETGAEATAYEAPMHETYTADASGNVEIIGTSGVNCVVSSGLSIAAAYTGSGWEALGAVQRVAVEAVSISPEEGLRVDTVLTSPDGAHQVPTFFNARGARYGLFRTSDGMMILGGMVLPNGQSAGVAGALVSPGAAGETRIGIETASSGTGQVRVDTAALHLVQPSFDGATGPDFAPTGEKTPVKIEAVRSTLLDGQSQCVDNYSVSIKALNALRLIVMGDGASELAWLTVQRGSEGSTIYTDGAYSASDSARTLSNFAPMIHLSMPTGESIVYSTTARRYMLDWKTIGDDYDRYATLKGGNQSLRDVGIVIRESGYYRFAFHADLEQASSSSGAVLTINRMPEGWTPPTTCDYCVDADLLPTRLAYRRAASAPLNANVTTCGLVADMWCFGGEKILPVVSMVSASKMLVPSGAFFTAQKIG
jgi:hypothetical protein